MKKKRTILICVICSIVLIGAGFGIFFAVSSGDQDTKKDDSIPDEGTASLTETSNWHSKSDNAEHTVDTYTLGTTAERVRNDLSDSFVINHKMIDGVPVYEMYQNRSDQSPILFFLHGQSSRKEENLDEMATYAEAGYFCVAVDLQGHGERITDEQLMGLEITKNTAGDIDLLLDYYESCGLADPTRFALNGFSQGGSVAYWYAAYGKRTPSALVVGSTSPDYTYSYDDKCICNGEVMESVWSESEIQTFIEQNNPILHVDRMMTLPILSGNSMDDDVVSYKGSESLEKKLKEGGNKDIRFYYFDNAGHNVTDDFVEKILPFLQEYLPVNE